MYRPLPSAVLSDRRPVFQCAEFLGRAEWAVFQRLAALDYATSEFRTLSGASGVQFKPEAQGEENIRRPSRRASGLALLQSCTRRKVSAHRRSNKLDVFSVESGELHLLYREVV